MTKGIFDGKRWKIPRGFQQSAQCCRASGYAGGRIEMNTTLKGLNRFHAGWDATLSGLKMFWTVDPG
jgi:hypothetical protein